MPRAPAPSAPSASTRVLAWRFICELLGGSLTGTGATEEDRRFANGMFSIYVDPKVVDTGDFFDGEVARYIDFFRAPSRPPASTRC